MRILIVVTSAARLDKFPRLTGYWIGEVTHAHEVLKQAGYTVDIVSPLGGNAPIDKKSLGWWDQTSRTWLADPQQCHWLEHTKTPAQIDPADYKAIYYAGGHGAMADLTTNTDLAAIAAAIYHEGGIVSAVCHGVAGLLPIRLNNVALVQNQTVTGFTNWEERLLRLTDRVPFLLEDQLKQHGADFKQRPPFIPHVHVSGRIITGQNPQSARKTAQTVVNALRSLKYVTTG